ncbi:MAG: hypothetical protein RLQ12_00975 [Cyclobacteriaceae bacterium]
MSFSCTLHLAGETLNIFKRTLLAGLKQEKNLFFCINDNPWEYHFEASNYMPVEKLSARVIEKHIQNNDFVKISDKIPLDNWDQFGDFSLFTLRRFLNLLE